MRSIKNRFYVVWPGTFGIIAVLIGVPAESIAQSSPQIQTTTKPQIEALQKEKASRSPAQKKMSSALLDALKSRSGAVSAGAPAMRAQKIIPTPEGVLVDITAQVSDELINEIKTLGGKVINKQTEYNSIRASMPWDKIETLAEREDVRKVKQAEKPQKNGAPAVEGDIAHAANLVRTKLGIGGAGIKVGVLSDSIDDTGHVALASAYNSKALDEKNPIIVLPGQEGDGAGEGLAMAEIIHVIAPKAQIFFATGDGGQGQMAVNIKELAKQGCQIIVDDLTYFAESPFQDGPISQAVNDVSSSGVLYFSSARNSGNKIHGTAGTWEGDFRDGGPAGPQFGDGKGRIHVFAIKPEKWITLNTADTASHDLQNLDRVDLFWTDPLGASTNDYDIYVVNDSGQVVRKSNDDNLTNGDPYESVSPIYQGESIIIVKAAGAEDRFLHLDTGRAVLRYGTIGSVRGHNASGADNAFSVAATPVPAPPTTFVPSPGNSVEKFSSDGPRRIFFGPKGTPLTPGNFSSSGGKILNKPDITAADGVSTTLPNNSGLNPFFGTSAAAPHAAGIAALLLSCDPKPSSDQVRSALQNSALSIEGLVPNSTAGHGIIMASGAAQALCLVTKGAPSVGAK